MDNSNPFQISTLPITIKHGSTLIIPITYKDVNGDVKNLTSYTAKLQVRQTPTADSSPDIELSTANGGITIDGTAGLVTLRFLSGLTLGLDENYQGTYDLYLIQQSSTAFCLFGGTFTVIPSTTVI